MKKILKMTVVILMAFCYTTSQAQKAAKVCKPTKGNATASCYTSVYAQNFKVCKSANGYYTCGATGDNSMVDNNSVYTYLGVQPTGMHDVPEVIQDQNLRKRVARPTYTVNTSQVAAGGHTNTRICKPTKDARTVSCYTTQYAENSSVCKSDLGYYICGKTPNKYNSTFKFFTFRNQEEFELYEGQNNNEPIDDRMGGATSSLLPENQSYVNIRR